VKRRPAPPRSDPEAPEFRLLFESAPGLYLVLAPDLTIVAVSDAYLKATMTRRAAILGRGIFDVFPDNPDDPGATGVANLQASLERVIRYRRPDTMAVQKYDIRKPRSQGGEFEERYWSPVNSPVLGRGGKLRYIIHRVEDVTQSVRLDQARAAERQARERSEELQHNLELLEATEEELRSSLEELEAADEELRRQNEELTRAHEELRLQEERLRIAVKNLPLVLFNSDRDLRFSWIMNPRHGLTTEQLIGRTDADVLPPEAAARAMAMKRRVIETGQGSRDEFRVAFPEGSVVYDITMEPLRDAAGRVIGLTGAAFDISERARLHETLRESEERYRLLFESNPHPMWVYDTETLRFLTVNAAALREYGYSREEFLGMTLRDIRPAEDVPALLEHVDAAPDAIESSAGWRHLRKDKSLMAVEIISHPLRFLGRPARLVLAWDVTERKRAGEDLRRAHDELRALVEASPQAIVSLDPAFRVQSWPGSAQRMFGWTAAEVIGQRLPIIPPELADEALDLLRRALGGQPITEFQTTRLHKDGSRIAVSLSYAALHAADGLVRGAVVVYSDITERLRAEQEARGRELAEAASRAKSQFLANMSHELRTPLNAIIGFSELLEDLTSGPLSDRQRRYVGNILTSGRHLLDLVNDILDLAKIEAGRLTLDATCFEPVAAIREVKRIVETLAVSKHLALTLVAPDSLPLITADRAKFKQILYNLLSNAIKFTPDGGRVEMRARTVSAPAAGSSESADWLVVEVEDTGIGIRPEDQSRVFIEFEQLDASYAREQSGTGLGLALTRRLVDLHGGRIFLDSREGKGSTFTVTLPPVPPSLRTEAMALEPAGVGGAEDGCPIVLIVEDDPVAAELLSHYLTGHGYAVAHAANAGQALEMAQRLKPVAITLDILLPDQDGLEVLARLRALAETERIPVIVVSITDDRELGLSLGASEWLVKPINRERFLAAVARAAPAPPKAGRQTVLVIDDHRETVDLLADTLEGRGFRALRAYGGEEGLQLAAQIIPDVIVLDLVMPGLSGFEVARRLQEMKTTRGIPILVFTFKELAEAERAALSGQVSRIVSKSDTGDLLAAIQRLSRGRAATRAGPSETDPS